jgi:hypothetical protein
MPMTSFLQVPRRRGEYAAALADEVFADSKI